ncbi:MAG: hypothetical protein AAFP70_18915 [Calditrichota bacterium]
MNGLSHQDCCPDEFMNKVDQYLDGSLDENEMSKFEQTFFQNDHCLQELQLRRQLRDLVKSEGKSLFPEYDTVGEQKASSILAHHETPFGSINWFYSAAAVFALLLLFQFTDNRTPTLKLPKGANSFSNNFVSSQQDQRYQKSSFFELLAEQQFRSHHIEIIEPMQNYIYRGSLLFRWRSSNNESSAENTLKLVIYNNRDQEILTAHINGGEFIFRNQLPPGLYYWSLENEKDTISIGRFLAPHSNMIEE